MATYLFSQVKGKSIPFDPWVDVLNFDFGSAADLKITATLTAVTFSLGTDFVTLIPNVGALAVLALTPKNVVFADGSQLLVGDTTTNIFVDLLGNNLKGSNGNDLLVGLTGNDSLDGGEGGDTYLVTGFWDGTDVFRDTGTTGIDRIVAGASDIEIELGTRFSNARTGIEVISANGHDDVEVVGTSRGDLLDFTGVSLIGLSEIDVKSGSDTVIGSAGNDTIDGGEGNDFIDGGAGRDTVEFAGRKASYSITTVGDSVRVRDLDRSRNGDDGTDTLKNVEVLAFSDGKVELAAPSPNRAPLAVDDALTTSEDTTLNTAATQLAGNDTDPDGNPLTVTAVGNATNGTVALANGIVTFIPTANFSGTATYEYTVSDGRLADIGLVTVNVTPVNDAPVLINDTLTSVAEDGVARVISFDSLLGNDSAGPGNEAGQTLIITAVGNAVGGSAVINGSNVVFTPAPNFNGAASFTYTVQDNGTTSGVADPKTASATASFVVTEVNDAPLGTDDQLGVIVVEDGAAGVISFASLLNNDIAGLGNEAGQTLTITAVSNAVGGSVVINGSNVVFAPAADFNGPASFTYTVQDNGTTNGAADPKSASATVSFLVPDVNDAPVATNDILSNVAEDSAARVISFASLLANDSAGPANEVGQTLTITEVSNAVGGSAVINGNNIIFTPAADFNGPASFTYTVRDNGTTNFSADPKTASANASFTATEVNDAPDAVNDGPVTTAEDTQLANINVLGNDSRGPANESAQTLTVISASALNGAVTINGDGTLNYSPNANYDGADTITYTIRDNGTSNGASDPKTDSATVAVNVTPAADTIVSGTVIAGPVIAGNGLIVEIFQADGTTKLGQSVLDENGQFTVNVGSYTGVVIARVADTNAGPDYLDEATGANKDLNAALSSAGVASTPDVPITLNVNPLTTVAYQKMGNNPSPATVETTNDAVAAAFGLTGLTTTTVATTNGGGYVPGDGLSNAEQYGAVLAAISGADLNNGGDTQATINNLAAGITIVGTTAVLSLDAKADLVNGAVAADDNVTGELLAAVVSAVDANNAPVAVADNATVAEGGTVTGNVLTNDSDAENNTLNAVLVAGAANGTVTLNADGSYNYTHNGGETTSDSFSYKANDGTADSNTVAVAITVTPVNDAPVAVADNATVAEGGTVTGNVLANDSDAENNTLNAVLVAGAANGTVTLNADGSYNYTHNGGETTSDSFSYKANDGTADSNTVVVAITVTPVNDAPVAVADNATVAEGGTVTGNVLTNDSDAENNTLNAVLVAGAANGTVTLNADGSYNYTHNGGETTSDSFSYKANDGTADSNTVAVAITVTPVNDAPVAVADNATVAEGGTVTGNVLANDSDAENNTLNAVLVAGAANGTVTLNADGSYNYTHNGGETTSDSFSYKANDGTADSNTVAVAITVTPVNDTPVAVADNATVAEGGTVTGNVLTNDSDAENNTLNAVLVAGAANGTVTLNADGSYNYTHNGGETTSDSFSYKANDGTADSNTVAVAITVTPVNDAPVAVADNATVAEGGTVTGNVLANDSDAENNTLNAVLVAGAANGTVTLNADGSYNYTHNGGETTSDSFSYKANDGTADSNTVAVAITVTPVNDAPVAVADNATVAEGGTVTGNVLTNDSDAENNTLNAVLVAGAANGTVTLNADGSYNYTHNGGETTSDSFSYKANDGTADSNTVAVAITVTPVNDAPVAVADNATVAEGGTVTGNVLTNDSDAENNTLNAVLVAGAANGTVTLNADGSYNYTHNGGETTSDSFSYKANDGTADSNTVAVAITVTPVNDAPVAVADNATVAEGGTVTGNVLANDSDAENNTLNAVLVAGAANGTVTLNADGSYSYTHNGGETTSDSFSYKANDGTADSNTVAVAISVGAVNNAPVAVADNATVAEGGTVTGNVLTNDSDAENNTLNAVLVAGAANGTVTLNADGSYNYTHNGGETTSDSFSYKANDGTADSNTVAVAITVTPVNDTPVAVADNATVAEGGTVTGNVLANDSDAENNTLNAVLVAGAANGTVTLNADGSYNYTHNGGETTSDSFSYKANDGTADSNTVAVAITVTPVNDTPVAVADNATVAEGGTVTGNVLTNDSDAENNTLNAVLVAGAANGTVTLNADGSYNYTHNGGETTSDSFSYKANDGTADSNTVAVAITVTPVNDAPVAVADNATVAEGGTVTGNVLANDSDAENNTLNAVLVAGAANGTVTLNADGSYNYTHNGGETTSDSFSYKANDGTADSNTVVVAITVTPVNDAPVAVADNATVAEGGTVTGNVLTNDSDAENNTLNAVLVAGAANGTVTLNADGSYNYTHNGGETTSDSFSYKANDGTADSNTVAVAITVTPVNDAPVAVADNATVAEGGTVTGNVLANDSDAENNTLNAVLVAGAANGTVTLNADGSYNYTHNGGETTSDSFSYKANDGTADSNTVVVAITVTPVNDAPVAVADNATVAEGGTVTGNVLTNDSDAENNTLNAVLVAGAANGTVTLNADGSYNYTHNGGETTSDSFSYKANDGTADSNTVVVAITVTPVNDAPVAVADNATVNKAGLVEIDVLANDTDAENDLLTAVLVSGPANGFVALDDNGLFLLDELGRVVYTHDGGNTTSDSFTYKANDGAADGNTVTVLITVIPNDPPVANADGATVAEGGTVTVNVLANDTDAENDPLTATIESGPAHGVLTPNGNGAYTYKHDGSATVSDSFTYHASDGTQDGNTATVTITITPANTNTPPIASPDTATAVEDGAPVVISVLANDTDADAGDTRRIVSVNTGLLQGSQVTVAADGLSVSYNVLSAFQFLTAGETETDTFSYTMTDSKGAQSTGVVRVAVIGVNDAPVAVNDFENTRVTEDSGPVRIDVLRNDTDADGDPFGSDIKTVVAVNTTGTLGSVKVIEVGGAVEYSVGDAFQALRGGESATDVFFYTMQDGSGVQSTARVEVTVIGADELPPPGSIIGTNNPDSFNAASTPPTTNGNDTVFGLFGDDIIVSNGGDDTLYGGPDRDDLDAGAGNDTLTGNADRDTLTGGLGADIFVFETLLDSEALDPDRVLDFNSAQGDKIDLRLIDANVFAAGNNAFALVDGAAFTRDVPGQLIFDPTTNLLQGDTNGNAEADFAILLLGVTSVSATDFLL